MARSDQTKNACRILVANRLVLLSPGRPNRWEDTLRLIFVEFVVRTLCGWPEWLKIMFGRVRFVEQSDSKGFVRCFCFICYVDRYTAELFQRSF